MNKSKHAMTLVMLTIFVVMVGIATQFSSQARVMPFVVGIPGIVLCLLQLVLDLRASAAAKRPQPADSRNEFEKAQAIVSGIVGQKMSFDMAQEKLTVAVEELPQEGEGRRELILWASTIGLVAGVVLFGFWPTIPVFLVLFLRLFAKKDWAFSIALGVAGTLVFFLVFGKGLGAILHGGFVTELLLDRFTGG